MGLFGIGRTKEASVSTDHVGIHELLTRGVTEVIVKEKLEAKLRSGERLRVKLGIDPTSPNLHIGRAVTLLKLRDFQKLGHQIVFILGDFTAVIGDTSDKDSERPMLAREVIEKNKQSYAAQAGKILDMDKVEFRYNSEWLEKLNYREIGEHADAFSVADFIARENIAKRLKEGKRVSLREVLYPLMQGYDSVAVRADVELGGTDQRFNLLAGRVLQEQFGQEPQNIVMGPLIEGTDGRKMSSSWGNVINLNDVPADMYGKVMSMDDAQVPTYLEVCTRMPLEEVKEMQRGVAEGTLHPKEAKMRLADEIVRMYHSPEEARKAAASFAATFSDGAIPDDLPEVTYGSVKTMREFVVAITGLSGSAATRLFAQGGIENERGEKILDPNAPPREGKYRIGKRQFGRIR